MSNKIKHALCPNTKEATKLMTVTCQILTNLKKKSFHSWKENQILNKINIIFTICTASHGNDYWLFIF